MRMSYLFLAVAIVAEVIATSFLKRSDGFTRPAPTLVTAFGYLVAFYFLSLALRTIPTGVAYAIWSGVGIVLVATIAWVAQGQKLDAGALAGMALIVGGVIVMNLFSTTTPHRRIGHRGRPFIFVPAPFPCITRTRRKSTRRGMTASPSRRADTTSRGRVRIFTVLCPLAICHNL
jgi:small multidrug resistance pump